MSIIAARRYVHGKPLKKALAVDGLRQAPLRGKQFDWIGLCDPTAAEMELLRTQYGLHPLAIEDSLNPNQMAKLELYGDMLFVIARTAALEEGENIAYGQTALFLGRHVLISVRVGSNRSHETLRKRLESDAQRLAEGPDYAAHAVLDYIVDGYQPLLDKLEDGVQKLEERAIDEFPQPSTIRRIFRLRRTFRRFVRVIGPMVPVCERLATTELPQIDAGARVWFRDVLDHARRTMIRIEGLKETLESIVETAALLEQHRQGDMTRQLAGYAAILAVPTAIAGIYGMNFDYMPELHHKWGYPAVLAAIVIICGGLWWRFRRIGWL